MSEKGRPLPKFGEWDVNDPASAEGFTVIFNKARDEKKTGGKTESPSKADTNHKPAVEAVRPQSCFFSPGRRNGFAAYNPMQNLDKVITLVRAPIEEHMPITGPHQVSF